MSPNDSLFDEPADDGNGAAPEGAPAPEGITAESIEAMLQPLQAKLDTTSKDLATAQEANRALEARLNAQPGPAPAPKTTPDDFVDQFAADPQGTIDTLVEKQVQDRLSQVMPFLEQTNTTTHAALVDSHQRSIDAQYGEGTWEAEIQPLFEHRMASIRQERPSELSNRSVIESEVRGIMGHKIDELSGRKASLATTAADARDKEDERIRSMFQMNGMTGGNGGAPPSSSKELTDAERDYLESKKRAGLTADIQTLRKGRSNSNSLNIDEWRSRQPAGGAAK